MLPLPVLPGTEAQLQFYCDQANEEPWKRAHVDAMRCYDFESILGMGVSIFRGLVRADLEYRTALHLGKGAYLEAFEKRLLELVRWWLRPCDQVEVALRHFEGLGFQVAHAEEFRKCCREANGILTPDEQSFGSEGLGRLSAEAAGAEAERKGSGTGPEDTFRALVEQWKAEVGPVSSPEALAMHPAYQRIIGLGRPAIPLLLRELEREPDEWFWALHAITGEDPVSVEAGGNLSAVAAAWVEWGKERGFKW